MKGKFLAFTAAAAMTALVVAAPMPAAAAADYPTRNISMIVPYNPGGSTDLTGRAIGDAMGKVLGKSIVVANTPGAGGAVGSAQALAAKKDGYTILANGMLAFTAMPVLGTSQNTHRDWDVWLATFTPNIVAVRKDSPYKTMEDLIAAMRKDPGKLTAGTGGPGSGGHIGAEVLRAALGIDYKHVPYQGGNPAVVATLSGEVDFTPQLLVEMEDLIKAGELRALACLTAEDIQIKNGPTIPSILKFAPDIKSMLPMGETTGLAVPKGMPENVLAQLDKAFAEGVKSKNFIDFCTSKGFIMVPMGRADAAKYVDNLASIVTWILYDAGVAKVSPEKFNIARQAK